MPLDERSYENRSRAESFGAVAAAYDRYRPSYPDELIDDLVARHPARALDIGSGTGKAARLLVDRGVAVLGVEIDPKMAEVAHEHGLAVEVGSFETWEDQGRTFDLITSAQAWHWVDPAIGAPKAARLLNSGGRLALFWNYEDFADDVQQVLNGVYDRLAPDLSHNADSNAQRRDNRPYVDDLHGTGAFASITVRQYRWKRTTPVDVWVGRVGTHSDHIALGPDRLAALQDELRAALLEHGDGVASTGGTYTIFATEPRS